VKYSVDELGEMEDCGWGGQFADDDDVCLTCWGEGVIEWSIEDSPVAYDEITCPACGGSGDPPPPDPAPLAEQPQDVSP